LKIEAEKYCALDCISLHQVIYKFGEMVFNLFGRNMHHYPTLPSLAFAIFRAKFMSEETIPQLSGKIARDIRNSYTGGSVDMYVPENLDNTDVLGYDVNSLYPSVMHSQAMPIGKPTLFEGDIRAVDPNAFWFFFCKIIAPDNLNEPIIQTHVKIDSLLRTMAPLGQWEDMLFSVEMDNAIKLGYKFEILWGYTFKTGYIFKEYVDTLYNLRLQYPKSDPLNLIAKLLLNSLYGRFGMDDSFSEVSILDQESYLKFERDHAEDIQDRMEIDNKVFIKHRAKSKDINTLLDNASETHNVSIGIASAITAYARIHMSQFKNNPDYILYYTDTDSAYINKPLSEDLVNSKTLGKMKLEHTLKKAIFLSPKMYYLETTDGKVIYKVKGLSHDIKLTLEDFSNLLYKDSFIRKFQTKWFKKLSAGHIEVLDQLYTLKVTENKRKLIFDSNNKLIGTKPYIINENKEIINK
jgi:DNA polymerase elongation subunit (family B)